MQGDNRRRGTAEPVRQGRREIKPSEGLPILEKIEGFSLTDDDVRRLRDDLQR